MMKYFKLFVLLIFTCVIFCSCDTEKTDNSYDVFQSEKEQLEDRIELLNQELNNVDQENQKLGKENNQLKSNLNLLENENDNNQIKGTELLEGDEILLYGSDYTSMVPAYGPIAILNPYAINTENSIKIISEDEYFTKIEIVGYIPKWYILKEEMDTINNSYGERYVIENCPLNILPENDSIAVNHLTKGTAVKIGFESMGWYYVESYKVRDANEVYWGWIHKDFLGNISDFESIMNLDAQVKRGITAIDDDEERVIYESNLWGEIIEEREDTYIISFPGLWFLEVNKNDVRFIE